MVKKIIPTKTATTAPDTVEREALPVNGLGEGEVPADEAPEAELELGTLVSVGVVVDGAVALAPGVFEVVIEAPGTPGAVDAADIVVWLAVEEPSTSFSVIANGELIARTSVMFETSTN